MARKYYLSHSIELKIPFFDVDSMHIVWHGHYAKYYEIARCALLDKLGYGYTVMRHHGYAWPIVQMQSKFIKPAHFGQCVCVTAYLTEYESCLKLDYEITDVEQGTVLHRAATTQAAVDVASGELQFQTPASWQEAVKKCLL